MKKKIFSGFVLLFLSIDVRAEDSTNAFDFETIAVTSSAAVGLTSSKTTPTNGPRAKSAFVTVETDDIRFRYDGSSPTNSAGHKILSTSSGFTIVGEENLRHFKAIGVDAACTLQVSYER